MLSSYVAFIVELIIVRTGVLLIETLGSFGVALNLFSADLGPSCHDFYFFIFLLFDRFFTLGTSLSCDRFFFMESLGRIPNFPWFFNSTDRLLEEQELTRKKEEYVAQLKSKLAQISVLISLS